MSVESSSSPALIKLNYLNGKIFYNNINYRQLSVYGEFEKCQIKDWDTKNNLWFDTTYGFRTIDTFNTWIRIAYLHKSNIRSHLINYFGLTEEQMTCLVGDATSTQLSGFLGDLCTEYL